MAGNAFLPQPPGPGLDTAAAVPPGASCHLQLQHDLDLRRDQQLLHHDPHHHKDTHAHHHHHLHHHNSRSSINNSDHHQQTPPRGAAASAAAHGAQHAHHRFPGRLPHDEWRREFHHNVMQKLFKEQRDRKVESNRNMSVIETDSDSENDMPDLSSQEKDYLKRLIEEQWRLYRESGNIPPEFASQEQPPPEFAERMAAEIIRQGQLQEQLQ